MSEQILDIEVTNYVKAKETVMGLTNKQKPYIGFTYPKSKKQIDEEKQNLILESENGNKKFNLEKALRKIRNHYNCYITLDKENKYKIITDHDKEYHEQNFRYKLLKTDITISPNKIKQIIKNEHEEISITTIFEQIKKEIKKYCYLKNEQEYDIIAIYIMLTYKYLNFDFMPIIHLNGEGGTGKSQIGKISTKLGFNSSATVSTTKSSFFRRVDRKRGLYFMDEKEVLQEHEKELLNGCTYEGNIHTVSEKEGDNYKDQEYNIYTPVMLACISDIYGATSTRTIKVETIRPPRNNKKYAVLRLTQDNKTWEIIRDNLCLWALRTNKETNKLLKVDEEMESLISNRGIDAWKIILNLSKELKVYNNLKDYIKNYYLDQIEEHQENDTNYKYLMFLYKIGDNGWTNSHDLFKEGMEG